MGSINVAVHDLIVDRTLTTLVLVNLCVAEKMSYYSQASVDTKPPADVSEGEAQEARASVDMALLRSHCEMELQGTVPTDGDAHAPKLPRHVSSVAQLLEYVSKVAMQQSAVLDSVSVAAAGDISARLQGLEGRLEEHSSRALSGLAALEESVDTVVHARLVEANETVSAALSELTLDLNSLETALGEELVAMNSSTLALVEAAGNATAQELFDYIFYNVSVPLRELFNNSLLQAQIETSAAMEGGLGALYANVTEGALRDVSDALEELVAAEGRRLLSDQKDALAVERAVSEAAIALLNEAIEGNATEGSEALLELKESTEELRTSTRSGLHALTTALETVQSALRNESEAKLEQVIASVASMGASSARLHADLAAAAHANTTRLGEDITDEYVQHVNRSVSLASTALGDRLSSLNVTIISDLAVQDTAMGERINGLNGSLSSRLFAVNASLTAHTLERTESLRRNLTDDVSLNVYAPLASRLQEVSTHSNASLARLNISFGERLGQLNTSVDARLELLREETDGGLAELQDAHKAGSALLHGELQSARAALTATNRTLHDELESLNTSMSSSLTRLQTQLQGDISSVHLIATMVNYTIVDTLLVDLRAETQANHTQLAQDLALASARAVADRDRSIADVGEMSAYSRELNATLSTALALVHERQTQTHAAMSGKTAEVNSTLHTLVDTLNNTWHRASADAARGVSGALEKHVSLSAASMAALNHSLTSHLGVYEEEMGAIEEWREQWVVPHLQRINATARTLHSDTVHNFTAVYAFMAANVTVPLAARANSMQEHLVIMSRQLLVDLPHNLSSLNASINADLDSLGTHVDTELTHLEAAVAELRQSDIPRINGHVDTLLNFSVASTLRAEGKGKQLDALGVTLTTVVQPQLQVLQSNVTTLLVDAAAMRQRLESTISSTVEPVGAAVAEAARRLGGHDTAIALLQQENATVHRLTTLFGDIAASLTATHGAQIAGLQSDLQLAEKSLTNVTLYVDRLVNKMEYVVSTNLVTQEAANARLEAGVKDTANKLLSLGSNVTMAELNIKQLQAQNKAKDEAHGALLLKLKGYDHELEALRTDKIKLEKAVEEDKKLLNAQAISVQLLESKVSQLERRNADLEADVKAAKSTMATQESVDQLRKLLFEMQSSVITHSNKVLDVVISSNNEAKK